MADEAVLERTPSFVSSGKEVDSMLDENISRLKKIMAGISKASIEFDEAELANGNKENSSGHNAAPSDRPALGEKKQDVENETVAEHIESERSNLLTPHKPAPAPTHAPEGEMRRTPKSASDTPASNLTQSSANLSSQSTISQSPNTSPSVTERVVPKAQKRGLQPRRLMSQDGATAYENLVNPSIQIKVQSDPTPAPKATLGVTKMPIESSTRDFTDAAEMLEKLDKDSSKSVDLSAPAAHGRSSNGFGSVPRPLSMFPGGLKVLIATWNIGNAMPLRSELAKWLPLNPACHIVAVGVQECSFKPSKARLAEIEDEWAALEQSEAKRSSRNSAFRGSKRQNSASRSRGRKGSTEFRRPVSVGAVLGAEASEEHRKLKGKRAKTFDNMVSMHYGSSYRRVARARLGDMRLIVLCKTELRSQVSHVKKAHKATGIGGVVGNKGGLMVKLRVAGTDLCFLSCHLAAHESEEKVAKRNNDVYEILKATSNSMKPGMDLAQQFDHTFVFGDLNYRIDLSITDKKVRDHEKHHEEVVELIKNRKGKRIVPADQLQREIKERRVLFGFNESTPTFAPTFKLFRKSGWHYNPQRIPSYCDRVLWTSLPGKSHKINQILYSSSKDVSTSDHKPVFSIFRIDVEGNINTSDLATNSAQPAVGHSVLHRFKQQHKADAFLLLTGLRVTGLGDRLRCSGAMFIRFSGPVQSLEKKVHLNTTTGFSHSTSGIRSGRLLVTDQVIDSTKLPLRVGNLLELDKHHLTVSLWEKQKATTRLGKQVLTLLGQCTIGLHPWGENPSRQSLSVPVVRYGVLVGMIDGEMELERLR